MEIISYSRKDLLSEDESLSADLSVFFGGRETSVAEGHSHGPYTHDYYDVNYIKRGSMILCVDGQTTQISENSLFIIPPYTVVEQKYTGEDNSVFYINVSGKIAERLLAELGFSKQSIVFPFPLSEAADAMFEEIVNTLPLCINVSVHPDKEKMKKISQKEWQQF